MSDLPPPVGIKTNASNPLNAYSMISRWPARNDSCPKYCLSACSILSKVKRFLTHIEFSYDDIPYLYGSCNQSRNIRANMLDCHPEHIRFTQCKLRERSVALANEMLRRGSA